LIDWVDLFKLVI